MDTIVERPGALDVHKAQVTACVRTPGAGRAREQHVAEFATTVAGETPDYVMSCNPPGVPPLLVAGHLVLAGREGTPVQTEAVHKAVTTAIAGVVQQPLL